MIHLQEFTFQKNGHSTEIKIGEFHIIIYLEKDKNNCQKKTIFIRPAVIFRNQMPYELKLRLFYGHSSEYHDIVVFNGKSYEEHSTSKKSIVCANIGIRNFSFSHRLMLLSADGVRPPKYLTLFDKDRRPLNVYMTYKFEGSHFITFYPVLVLINNASIPISFYYQKGGISKMVPGQTLIDYLIPCDKTKKIAIGMGYHKSSLFNITAVGAKNIVQFDADTNDDGIMVKYQFVYNVYLSRVLKDDFIFTRIVTLSPRFLLENSLDADLIIRQYRSASQDLILARQSKEPFHWPDANAEQFLNIRIGGGHWGWTGPFSISSLGNFILQSKDLSGSGIYRIINVEIELQDCTAYVLFREETETSCSYKIENNTSTFSIAVYQRGNRDELR